MAWSFVAASSAVATGANPAPGVPTGTASGDILVLVASSGAAYSATPPTGYTELVRNTAASPFLVVWWKTAGSSESAPTATNANTTSKASLLCYRNSSGTDVSGAIATGSTTTVTTTTVNTTANNDLVLNLYGGGVTASATGAWSGGSANVRVTSGTSTTIGGLYCTDELQASTGATTGRAGTLSRASTGTQGVTLTFKSSPHANTGALTGQIGSVAGTAAHNTTHTTSGALAGPGSTVAGTAAHQHATTGVLTGPGSTVTGSAVRFVTHGTSGTVTGPGAVIQGVATRTGSATPPTTGGAGSRQEKKKRYERHGHRLLVFTEPETEAEVVPETPEEVIKPEKVKPAEVPAIEFDLNAIEKMAKRFNEWDRYSELRRKQHFDALIALYQALMEMQDEEEVLLLLTL